MLRAPIWTTSACSWTTSAWLVSSSSVTTGSPVSARASARISSPAIPRPLNANGDVRGLNAPPRSIAAPCAATVRATSRVCSRDSPVDAEDRGLVVCQLGGGELVGPRDRDHAVDAGHALEAQFAHALRVADRPDR